MNGEPTPQTKRPEFLIEIYKQMMNDINRHILVVWQSIGVVIGSFAILGLVEKKVLSLDLAASLGVLICSWGLGLVIDSSYWYNRNLCIIANIERLFLKQDDLRNVHYYFAKHRPKNRMTTTLKIQFWLSTAIALLMLLYHLATQVLPGLGLPLSSFDPPRALPYVIAVATTILLSMLRKRRDADYQEFLRNSPGIEVPTEGILYGGGHGFKKESD
jgi:hypothetical protein